MTKRLFPLFSVACLALFTGCLDFEQQTLTYRYDAKTDTLRIFQSYQGIFGEDTNDGLSPDEIEQLDSVLSGQRTFFFANWIWEYNHDELRQTMDELKHQTERAGRGEKACQHAGAIRPRSGGNGIGKGDERGGEEAEKLIWRGCV